MDGSALLTTVLGANTGQGFALGNEKHDGLGMKGDSTCVGGAIKELGPSEIPSGHWWGSMGGAGLLPSTTWTTWANRVPTSR